MNNRFALITSCLFLLGTLTACGGGGGDSSGSSPGTSTTPPQVNRNPSPAASTANSFAYVMGSDSVSAFKIDPTSGTLKLVGTLTTPDTFNRRMAVHPSGKFAYVFHWLDSLQPGDITAYQINAADGTLTNIEPPAVTGQGNCCLTMHPSGNFLYAGTDEVHLQSGQVERYVLAYAVNATTGALSYLGRSLLSPIAPGTSAGVYFIDVDPTGRFAYVRIHGIERGVNAIQIYTINATNGALTPVAAPNLWADTNLLYGMTMHPSGKFAYLAFTSNYSTFWIQPYTIEDSGALTELGTPAPAGQGPVAIVVDPTGRFLYSADAGSGGVSGYIIDPATGMLTSVGPARYAGAAEVESISVDPSARFVYALNHFYEVIYAYTINPATGVLTSMGEPVPTIPQPTFITTVRPSN